MSNKAKSMRVLDLYQWSYYEGDCVCFIVIRRHGFI